MMLKTRTIVRPADNPLTAKTQVLEGKWSPQVVKNGIGFAFAWIAKQQGMTAFEIADTNSMLPLFDYGHTLYCVQLKPEDKVSMYDVCVYETMENDLIVHRVVKTDYVSNRFYFKGDNNFFADGWIDRVQVKYRVAVISYDR